MSAQKFLVGDSASRFADLDFVVVNAPDERSAREAYIKNVAITDPIFLEHVYDRTVNASFAECFWIQTPEEVNRLQEEGAVSNSDDEFNVRVQRLFGAHQDFADTYLDFLWADDEVGPEHGAFPDEMLAYMLTNNANWVHLTVVPCGEIVEIQA